MSKTLIRNAAIVNEGRTYVGSVSIEGDAILQVVEAPATLSEADFDHIVDAEGLMLLPGVIDTHVHFRDGGLSDNPAGTFYSESRAARAGGVTSVVDMPNTNPPTTTLQALEAKEAMAQRDSVVNYGFMLGATTDNIEQLLALPPTRYAAIKVFLGSSTGNMLLSDPDRLDLLFREANKLIVAHCEDERTVQTNMRNYKLECQGTERETAALHPHVRNSEACFLSTYHAIERARRFGTRLHIAHISTATELSLLSNFPLEQKRITAEVTPNHLWFDDRDYPALGNLIKCNPAIKSNDDRLALWAALYDGLIDTVATDHAPHPLEAKQRPYFDAPSGIPSIQHSLPLMLEASLGAESLEWEGEGSAALCAHLHSDLLGVAMVVEKMCHAPARLFGIEGRGYIRPGYKADLVLVRPKVKHTICNEELLYKCGWSPLVGQTLHTEVCQVWVNGQADGGAQPLAFSK